MKKQTLHLVSNRLYFFVSSIVPPCRVTNLQKKKGIARSTFMRWVRIFEESNPEMAHFMKKEKSPTPSEDSAAITALLLENERLRTELKHEKMRAHAYDTMIDVAEEMFNIPIRKKADTKQ